MRRKWKEESGHQRKALGSFHAPVYLTKGQSCAGTPLATPRNVVRGGCGEEKRGPILGLALLSHRLWK